MNASSEDLFPMFLYLYDRRGKHSGKRVIDSDARLRSPGIRLAIELQIRQNLEVMITDALDQCLFHAENGRVVHDSCLLYTDRQS